MVMKIYANPYSNGERAILPLFFADVDVEKELELVMVSIAGKQHLTPAYKAKNPFGLLPYLEDGDLGIFGEQLIDNTISVSYYSIFTPCVAGNAESRAIAKYFVDKYNLTFLVGTTPKEKATINQWVESESQNFCAAVEALLREAYGSLMENRPLDEKLKASSMETLGKVLDVYEAQLFKHKYLAGDSYTLADAFHTPLIFQVSTLDVFAGAFDNRPHVKAWVAGITSHPAYLKTRKLDWDNATPF